jgi:Novel STAND NTPase 1
MPLDRIDSPYVGLAPFTEDQAPFFFGRERDQQFVVANLFATRLTILYGPSAAGKSSLLRAGVVRELLDRMDSSRRLLGQPDLAFVYHATWEGDVHERLCTAVRDALRHVRPDALEKIPARARLSELLTHAVRITQGDFFLILDQFEEYFVYQPEQNEPPIFERELADAITRPHLPVGFVIALRDDELSRLDRLKPLVPSLLSNPVSLRRLTADQARQAITAPLEKYNTLPPEERTYRGTFSVETALVEAVVEEVKAGRVTAADEPAQAATKWDEIEAAYLQLVMTAIWEREVAVGSTTLHRDTLRALNGAQAIVRRYFDAVMEQLSADDRDISARMFAQLVTPSGRKIPHRLGDLATYGNVSIDGLKPVVAKLVNAKILVSVGLDSTVEAARTYAIRHDSLGEAISAWQRRYVSERDRTIAAERQQIRVREAQAQAERDRAIAQERASAAKWSQYASIALAGLLGLAVMLSAYSWRQKTRVDEILRREQVRAAAGVSAAQTDLDAARITAQSAEDRLATYLVEVERNKGNIKSLQFILNTLKTDRALNARVAAIARLERERDEARQRVAAVEKQMDAIQRQVTELTEARDRAIQQPPQQQAPVIILRVRPRHTRD